MHVDSESARQILTSLIESGTKTVLLSPLYSIYNSFFLFSKLFVDAYKDFTYFSNIFLLCTFENYCCVCS